MRNSCWFATLSVVIVCSACNYTEGECYPRGQGGGGVGAGVGGAGGVIVPAGPGGSDSWDVPPKPQDASGPMADCNMMGGFSTSLFKFKKTQEDDGVGFGWQEAQPTLKFVDGRQDPIQTWSCTINVGMPLRTVKLGQISAEWAAEASANIATDASSTVMHSKDSWTPGAFCKAFKDEMNKLFGSKHEGLGARVTVVSSS